MRNVLRFWVMKDEKIPARPTWFEGILYRSQIEARWALFFRLMDIPAEYEETYFDLGGIFYRPDFWLPKQNCWVEVKGPAPSAHEKEKARRLATHTSRPVYVVFGPIPEPNPENESWYTHSSLVFFPDGAEDEAYWWCQCPICGSLGLQFEARAIHLSCGCLDGLSPRLDKSNHYYSRRLLTAYSIARRAEVDQESLDGRDRLVEAE
jgi:hypothetical protein